MSPEQVKDPGQVDARSDLWSLGIILYELLTGDVPIEEEDLLATYNAIAVGRYKPLFAVRPDVPSWISHLVDDLIEVDIEKRIQTADNLIERLDRGAASAADRAPAPPPRRNLALIAAPLTVLGVGMALVAVVMALGALLYLWPSAPKTRAVVIEPSAVPDDQPVFVTVNRKQHDGHASIELAAVEAPGQLPVYWAIGAGCQDCPDRCPEWCATGEVSFDIEVGVEVSRNALSMEPPGRRPLKIRSTAPLTKAAIGGSTGQIDGMNADFDDLRPGRYPLLLEAGQCAFEHQDCVSAPSGCPAGCSSLLTEIVVPLGAGLYEAAIELPSLEVVEEVEPAPAVPNPVPRADRLVSGTSFARFIDTHADWSKENAQASGRADAGYLRDWTDGPTPGPVTRVTWGAAVAYCAGRGGLRPLDAEPHTWSDSAVRQEWRDDGGRPAWRRQDGQTSTAATANRAFPFTGFRCGP